MTNWIQVSKALDNAEELSKRLEIRYSERSSEHTSQPSKSSKEDQVVPASPKPTLSKQQVRRQNMSHPS